MLIGTLIAMPPLPIKTGENPEISRLMICIVPIGQAPAHQALMILPPLAIGR
jgi:hypothetical protein